ncbi:MAG: hypothetical protein QXK88_05155 [Desulfurococcaceae archaeon]
MLRKKLNPRWLQLSSKYAVHICQYTDVERFFSRHYSTGLSTCRKLGIYELEFLKQILTFNEINALVRNKELVLADQPVVQELLSRLALNLKYEEIFAENPHTYIIISESA